jgi:2,4-dienoyl-CoA reductase-like NADH-dependent reductase (Old Yellow Enzyme family)
MHDRGDNGTHHQKHAEAAAFAKHVGFGMVTIHGGHGWLLHQFMSPSLNTRTDMWGGTLRSVCAFLSPVSMQYEGLTGRIFRLRFESAFGVLGRGYDIDYGIKIAKALDGRVELIHVSAGSHEDPRVFTVTIRACFWRTA